MHEVIEEKISAEYNHGFVTDIDADNAPKGLNEDIIRFIYAKKNEPEWMLVYRLEAFRNWLTMEELDWAHVSCQNPDFQEIIYYSAPKPKKVLKSLDEVDPELLKTFQQPR
jgi:Fe-S cluster assembly protein SufB